MKSNISKHFAAKAKQGLRNCFADGMVQLPNSEFIRTGMQTFAAQENAKVAEAQKAGVQYAGPTTTDMKDKMIEINNQSANPSYQFGIESPNGRGAQHQFANQSMSDLQGGNNQPYTPGSAGDPHASASIGPKGPTRLPQASPSRTPLRQWQEPAFADGVVPETADQLMARMTAKYGAPSAGTRAPEPAPTPAPQPVQQAPQPKPQTGGLFDQALRGLRGANDELHKAANYKNGMVHEGPGIVHGPGTTTSDSVNAKLSKDEAVLPAATVAALGGPDAVAELIERTNGKAPARGLREGAHANSGVVAYDPLKDPSRAHAPYTPPIEAPRTTDFVQDGVRSGQPGAQSASRPNWIDPTKQVATVTNPPNISDPNVIEGQSRRVPNTGTAVTTVDGQGARTANVDRMTQADYARGMRNGQAATHTAVVEPVAPKGNPYNPNINPAEILKSLGENKAVQMGGKVAKVGLKASPYVAGVVDASGIVDVATDPNRSKADVATEVARDMGRWGSATGAGAAAAGASLPFAPIAGPAAPAVPIVAGLLGGAAGYFGADKLMDVGSGQLSPSSTSYGAVKKTLGLKDPNAGAAEKAANEAALNGGNGSGVIPGMLSKEQLKAQAAAGLRKTQQDNLAYDASPAGIAYQARLDAASGKTATAAASKAGSFPGQNRIPEAVTVQDQAASDMMGKEVDKLTGVSSTGDQGVRGMAQRMDSYANNESARQARNAQLQLRGDGARYEKGADGKITLTNSGDFDGSTKMPYTGADGKPTAVFAGSMENQRGIADAKGVRKQLANIEQMNLERNAKDDITDVGLRTYSRGVLKDQAAQNAKYNETMLSKQPSQLDIEKFNLDQKKFGHELQKTENLQANNIRDYKATRSDKVNGRVEKLLDTMSPVTGLKDEALTAAHARRADLQEAMYAAFGKNMPEGDAQLDEAMPQMMAQAKASLAIRDAVKNRGLLNKIGNVGRDPWTTLHAAKLTQDGSSVRFENGFTISVDDIVKDGNAKSADILAALQSRMK